MAYDVPRPILFDIFDDEAWTLESLPILPSCTSDGRQQCRTEQSGHTMRHNSEAPELVLHAVHYASEPRLPGTHCGHLPQSLCQTLQRWQTPSTLVLEASAQTGISQANTDQWIPMLVPDSNGPLVQSAEADAAAGSPRSGDGSQLDQVQCAFDAKEFSVPCKEGGTHFSTDGPFCSLYGPRSNASHFVHSTSCGETTLQQDFNSHSLDTDILQNDFNSHALANQSTSQCEPMPDELGHRAPVHLDARDVLKDVSSHMCHDMSHCGFLPDQPGHASPVSIDANFQQKDFNSRNFDGNFVQKVDNSHSLANTMPQCGPSPFHAGHAPPVSVDASNVQKDFRSHIFDAQSNVSHIEHSTPCGANTLQKDFNSHILATDIVQNDFNSHALANQSTSQSEPKPDELGHGAPVHLDARDVQKDFSSHMCHDMSHCGLLHDQPGHASPVSIDANFQQRDFSSRDLDGNFVQRVVNSHSLANTLPQCGPSLVHAGRASSVYADPSNVQKYVRSHMFDAKSNASHFVHSTPCGANTLQKDFNSHILDTDIVQNGSGDGSQLDQAQCAFDAKEFSVPCNDGGTHFYSDGPFCSQYGPRSNASHFVHSTPCGETTLQKDFNSHSLDTDIVQNDFNSHALANQSTSQCEPMPDELGHGAPVRLDARDVLKDFSSHICHDMSHSGLLPDQPGHASPVSIDANFQQRDFNSRNLDANFVQKVVNSHSLANTLPQCGPSTVHAGHASPVSVDESNDDQKDFSLPRSPLSSMDERDVEDASLCDEDLETPRYTSEDAAYAAVFVPEPLASEPDDELLAAAGYLTNEELMQAYKPATCSMSKGGDFNSHDLANSMSQCGPIDKAGHASPVSTDANLVQKVDSYSSQCGTLPDQPGRVPSMSVDAKVVQSDFNSHVLGPIVVQNDFNSQNLANRSVSQCGHTLGQPDHASPTSDARIVQKDSNSQDTSEGDSLFDAITAFYERQTAPLPPEVSQQDLVDLCEQTLPGWWQQYLRRKRRLQQRQPPKRRGL